MQIAEIVGVDNSDTSLLVLRRRGHRTRSPSTPSTHQIPSRRGDVWITSPERRRRRMDHHHRHNPHPHSARYAPLPPQHQHQLHHPQPQPPPPASPVFLAPDPYRRQPHLSFPTQPPPVPHSSAAAHHHHHHRPENTGGIVYVSYAPSPVHNAGDRGRLLVPAEVPERLVHRSPPHPPVPAPRVSDRIIFPEGHPEGPRMQHQQHPRRSEGFVREEDFRRGRIRVLEEGQGGIPYGRREGEAVDLAEQEEASSRLGLLGRKRHRWEEVRVFGKDSFLESIVQGRDAKRLTTPGASASRHRSDVVYDLRAVDGESSRGSTYVFSSERDQAMVTFPRPPAEMSRRSSPVYSVSKVELLGKSRMMESETIVSGISHGFREKNLASGGRRYAFGGEEEVHAPPKKPWQQKPSVLSRIQFARPVYKRKPEQEIGSPMSPLPVSQTLAFSEGKQFEMDAPVKLDVSFKTDGLVAKEILTSPISASPRSIGEVCGQSSSGKNVAKDTAVSLSVSSLRSESKVTATHTRKLKIREERFAHFNAGWKSNKERILKMSNRVSASSNSTEQNFDDEVVFCRTPKGKVKNEVSVSPNPMQISADRVPPVRTTEKKMSEKALVLPLAGVQRHGGKITSSRSPKRKHAKEILVRESNFMGNFNDRNPTQQNLEFPSSDGISTTERCPEGKLAGEILAKSTDAETSNCGTVNSMGSGRRKLAKETLVAQKTDLLHRNKDVTSVNDGNKSMLDNISFPSVPGTPSAKDDSITERREEKRDKDAFISPSSVLNSDKRVTTVRILKKKIIKRTKKKKVVAPIAPCLPSMDPPEKISKECVSTNSSVKGIETSKETQYLSTEFCSSLDHKILEEEKRAKKHSETVQEVSTSGFSCEELKDFDDCAKLVSGYSEVINSSIVGPKKKVNKESNTGELTLIPCTLDPCPLEEMSETPLLNNPSENLMHSKEVQRGSLSNCIQKCVSCSDGAHKDKSHGEEVHQDRLNAGSFHNGPMLNSDQGLGHLNFFHDGPKMAACMDVNFQKEGQEQHILTSHSDMIDPVSLGKAENSNAGKLGLNNSISDFHLQKKLSFGHLETNVIEAPSDAILPVEVDTNETPLCSLSIEKPAENFKSPVKQQQSRGYDSVYLRKESGSGKHFSVSCTETFPPGTVCGKKLHVDGMTFFDGETSHKADSTSSNRNEGQNFSPIRQTSVALEELETGCRKTDANPVSHRPRQGISISLQAEVQNEFSKLEKEIKQEKTPAGVISTENRLGQVDTENNIVEGNRERELHVDVLTLPIKTEDAVLNSILYRETDGQEGTILHLSSTDVFPQSSPAVAGVECPVDSPLIEQVSYTVDSFPLNVSEKDSPQVLATVSEEMHQAEVKQTVSDILDLKSCDSAGILGKPHGDSNSKNDYSSDSMTPSVAGLKLSGKLDLINLSEKTQSQQTKEAEKRLGKVHELTPKENLTGGKVCQRPVPKMFSNQKGPSTRTFKKPPSLSTRHNKWYRTDNPPVSSLSEQVKWPGHRSSSRQSPKKLGKIHSSYVRKGNSLIRKSSPAIPSCHPHPEQTAMDQIHLPETNKNVSFENKIASADSLNFSGARTVNSSFERPKTPPLPLSSKSTHPSLGSLQTLMEIPLSEPCGEDNVIPLVGTQGSDVNEENHSIVSTEESKVSGKKKLIYVKHRSNQLVAASAVDASNASVHTTEESPALPCAPPDIYYRNKNKLIRDTSLSDGQAKQEISLLNGNSGGKSHGPSKMPSLKNGAEVPRKTRLERAMEKTYKHSRFSLVWTLNGSHLQNSKQSNILKHRKVLPYLFPWKRTYRRDFVTKRGSKHSPSSIRSKLQLFKQRHTIYTISKSGFSLRKSGVLGVSGSNLKWSKSMERRSRKANEEAAVARMEHERKKKKLKGTTNADLTMKSENCSRRKLALDIQLHQGERIFRVGNVHYKMDSSRRTLVRIPDEQAPSITNSQLVHGAKMSIVPRRLSIGNDEYVRIGNGNKLVRDPKKLVRILANEKIRWSLHTARLRSVRKQQYCQFFTRFGKCNKEDGKCPYIHDPTKIAICTKFLKGLCSSPNCKLTHKVIPERMPDCSYFLQGLCTNMSCPYRHVKVNAKASVCEGFLKGYCRDGDECHKKHSYVCPYFEASGECHQRATCKLHHPKHASKQACKSRKRKRTPIHDHGRGRYFGGSVAEAGESHVSALSRDTQEKDGDIFCQEGRFTEYISLDVATDDDDVEHNDLMDSRKMFVNSDLSDSESSDIDALIKPIRIMNMD